MKRYALLGIIFLLVVGLAIGCAPNQRVNPNDPGQNPNNQFYNNNNMDPNYTNPNNVNPGVAPENYVNPAVPRENMTPDNTAIPPRNNNTGTPNNNNRTNNDMNRSEDIVQIVEEMDGVNAASAVVAGETAYVGIDIDRDITDSDTNELKEEVGKRVREEENITRVYVSADVDTVERLQGIGRDIGQGRPVSGFLDELTEMFRRPTPSIQ